MNKIYSYRFPYDGLIRHVDNVEFEPMTDTLIGFEMRKGGKFSYKIKRYSLDKIKRMELIEPFIRVGPKIGRPEEAGR